MILKLKSSEVALTTASTVSSASVVRVYAAAESVVSLLDTVANGSGVIGTVTMPSGSIAFFEKEPLEQLSASVSVQATSIAYSVS